MSLNAKPGRDTTHLRAHIGFEFFFDIGSEVSLFISSDLQFHQDGQTNHMPNTYSQHNPWEREFSIAGGVELGDVLPGRHVRIELGYHNGRVSTTNWFYQRCEVAYIGLSIG